jgi:hypothetical protein
MRGPVSGRTVEGNIKEDGHTIEIFRSHDTANSARGTLSDPEHIKLTIRTS